MEDSYYDTYDGAAAYDESDDDAASTNDDADDAASDEYYFADDDAAAGWCVKTLTIIVYSRFCTIVLYVNVGSLGARPRRINTIAGTTFT